MAKKERPARSARVLVIVGSLLTARLLRVLCVLKKINVFNNYENLLPGFGFDIQIVEAYHYA